jgi:hypothetical protein
MASHHRPERSGLPERRRNTGSGYRENSAPYARNRSALTVRTSSDSSNTSRNLVSQQQEQQNSDTFNFFGPEIPPTWTSSFPPTIYQNGDHRESPGPPGLLVPTSLAFLEQMVPQFDDTLLYSTYASLSPAGSVAYNNSWDIATPSTSYVNTGNGDSPISNGPSGTYGSLDDITVSTPDTLASGFSDGSVNFRANSVFGSPTSNSASLVDMKLPGELLFEYSAPIILSLLFLEFRRCMRTLSGSLFLTVRPTQRW